MHTAHLSWFKIYHRFYSPTFTSTESLDLEKVSKEGVADEVALLRVGIRRLFAMAQVSTTPAEWATILDAIGTASVRIAGLLRTQRMIEGGQSNLSEVLSQALTEVCNELPWRGKVYFEVQNNILW
jgi:hypothetical protein